MGALLYRGRGVCMCLCNVCRQSRPGTRACLCSCYSAPDSETSRVGTRQVTAPRLCVSEKMESHRLDVCVRVL